jgi:hypothetical protein
MACKTYKFVRRDRNRYRKVYRYIRKKPRYEYCSDGAFTILVGQAEFGSHVSSVAATATVTFTGWPTIDDTVTIIDSAGTSRTYTAKAGEDADGGQFDRGDGGTESTAESLKNCIEHASGHNGTITVVKDDDSGGLTLTQAVHGAAGNTTITDAADNMTVTNFTGGVTSVDISDAGPVTVLFSDCDAEAAFLQVPTVTATAVDSETNDSADVNVFITAVTTTEVQLSVSAPFIGTVHFQVVAVD